MQRIGPAFCRWPDFFGDRYVNRTPNASADGAHHLRGLDHRASFANSRFTFLTSNSLGEK